MKIIPKQQCDFFYTEKQLFAIIVNYVTIVLQFAFLPPQHITSNRVNLQYLGADSFLIYALKLMEVLQFLRYDLYWTTDGIQWTGLLWT